MPATMQCAYASGAVDTRDGCECPRCRASRYHRPVGDAIAEVNAVPRSRPVTGSLAGAFQDLRVSLTDARDEYESAVARAERIRGKRESSARARYRTACKRVRDAAVERRAWRRKIRGMSDDHLAQVHAALVFKLGPGYALYRDPDERVIHEQHLVMLEAEMTRPFRTQDQAVTV